MSIIMNDYLTRLMRRKTLSHDRAKARLFLLGGVGLMAFLSAGYWLLSSQIVFCTTISPNKTYTIRLKGSKARALLLPTEVRADVLKEGQLFASDIWLHSSRNSFDLSFDAGYPNLRWLNDNVVEFYRHQYFDKGSDRLTIQNTALKPVKYIRVQSLDKFLLFDFQPAALVSMDIPAPRGDFQWIAVEGVFSDGQIISFNHKNFDRRSSQLNRYQYQIQITATGSTIEATEQH